MKNSLDQEINEGDTIVFIRNQRSAPACLKYGTVCKVNNKSIDVNSEQKKFVLCSQHLHTKTTQNF